MVESLVSELVNNHWHLQYLIKLEQNEMMVDNLRVNQFYSVVLSYLGLAGVWQQWKVKRRINSGQFLPLVFQIVMLPWHQCAFSVVQDLQHRRILFPCKSHSTKDNGTLCMPAGFHWINRITECVKLVMYLSPPGSMNFHLGFYSGCTLHRALQAPFPDSITGSHSLGVNIVSHTRTAQDPQFWCSAICLPEPSLWQHFQTRLQGC